MDTYNYTHFHPESYDFKVFKGPNAGEKYIDFEARTLDGQKVMLSDYLDKPIVLDTGSITCPMYANTQSPMNTLKDEYPDVHFLLLYVREAHPGGRTTASTSMEEKISNAKSTQSLYSEKREILVDSLDGHAHKLYGAMPNMTYVIGTDGIIRFRANWTDIQALKKVLVDMDCIETKDFYEISKPSPFVAIRTLLIGGVSALYEFIVGLPKLIAMHNEVRRLKE